MKITIGQLKEHVRAAIANVTPRDRKRLREVGERSGPYESATDPAENALDAIRDAWYAMHDSGDPSMEAAGGEPAWHRQVDAAVMSISEEIRTLVERAESDLMDGQFYGD